MPVTEEAAEERERLNGAKPSSTLTTAETELKETFPRSSLGIWACTVRPSALTEAEKASLLPLGSKKESTLSEQSGTLVTRSSFPERLARRALPVTVRESTVSSFSFPEALKASFSSAFSRSGGRSKLPSPAQEKLLSARLSLASALIVRGLSARALTRGLLSGSLTRERMLIPFKSTSSEPVFLGISYSADRL